jgi:AcrR family transcriptional regulator
VARSKKPIKPRKLPAQERSKVTYDAILKATAQVLAAEGVDRVNTNRVAEVAGVSIGSLYQYFPNKEAMMQALIDSYSNRLVEHLSGYLQQLSQEPAAGAIRSYVKAMLSLPREDPELHRAFVLVVFKLGHASIRQLEEQLLFIVRAYLETQKHRLIPKNLDLAAFILVTTVESVTNIALLKHPEYISTDEFEIELSSIITRYLIGSDELS